MDASFEFFGGTVPASPVVVSVPHAGRDYPLSLRAAARVPVAALMPLEDRHVDAVAQAARTVETMLVQRRARAWIDLNRGEDERDFRIDEGADQRAQPQASAKVRSGLGLIPRRAGRAGDLWRRRFGDAEVTQRIVDDHRPYHRALADALAAARARFGIAVLIDVHSMPPIPDGPAIVLGDRFGRSAGPRFVARLEAETMAERYRSALNTPYAGGHILDRHGDPANGVHAIQLEIDRSAYLDAGLQEPGDGFPRMTQLLGRMLAALADEALAQAMLGHRLADAAE